MRSPPSTRRFRRPYRPLLLERRVPCFRGSLTTAKSMQNNRESMRTVRGLHAFAVISPAIRFLQRSRESMAPMTPKRPGC